jgi:hypothetical protein
MRRRILLTPDTNNVRFTKSEHCCITDVRELIWDINETRLIDIDTIILLLATTVQAKRLHPEKHYQAIWCQENGGQVEVVLPAKTRCDCLTDTLVRVHQKKVAKNGVEIQTKKTDSKMLLCVLITPRVSLKALPGKKHEK